MPSARREEDIIDLSGPPGTGLVGMHGNGVSDDFLNDSPSLLDDILTGKERLISLNGIADQPLVRGHLIGLLVNDLQLHRLTDHALTIHLDLHPEGNLDAGSEEEAYVVVHRGLLVGKDDKRGSVELHTHLGA